MDVDTGEYETNDHLRRVFILHVFVNEPVLHTFLRFCTGSDVFYRTFKVCRADAHTHHTYVRLYVLQSASVKRRPSPYMHHPTDQPRAVRLGAHGSSFLCLFTFLYDFLSYLELILTR